MINVVYYGLSMYAVPGCLLYFFMCFESILFSSFINDFEMIPVTPVVIILVINFMHDIYNYIPETNHVYEA